MSSCVEASCGKAHQEVNKEISLLCLANATVHFSIIAETFLFIFHCFCSILFFLLFIRRQTSVLSNGLPVSRQVGIVNFILFLSAIAEEKRWGKRVRNFYWNYKMQDNFNLKQIFVELIDKRT